MGRDEPKTTMFTLFGCPQDTVLHKRGNGDYNVWLAAMDRFMQGWCSLSFSLSLSSGCALPIMPDSQFPLVPTLHSIYSSHQWVLRNTSHLPLQKTHCLRPQICPSTNYKALNNNITYLHKFLYSLYFQVLVMPHENNKSDLFLARGHLYHS
jgi:hypothetical protein